MPSKLRVGLLQNSMHVPAWAFRMLEQIKESDCATIQLIVLNDSPQKEQHGLTCFYRNRKQILAESGQSPYHIRRQADPTQMFKMGFSMNGG